MIAMRLVSVIRNGIPVTLSYGMWTNGNRPEGTDVEIEANCGSRDPTAPTSRRLHSSHRHTLTFNPEPEMINMILLCVSGFLAVATAFADCELLSVADAELVLRPSVSDLSEDAASQCTLIGGSPQGTFVIQFGSRDYYNQVTILPPHTPADVGDEGRSNVDNNGVTALQFSQGDKSVTMSVRPVSSSDRDYLGALVTVGQHLAERLE